MVFGYIGRRDEDGRLAEEAQLGDRAGTSTRHHDVCHSISQIHTLDEGRRVDGEVIRLQELLRLSFEALTRLPDEGDTRLSPLSEARTDTLVDTQSAETPADDDDDALRISWQAEVTQRFFAQPVLHIFDSRTQGIPRQHDLLLREEALHLGVRYADAVGTTSEELIRHASVRVLLLDERGDAEALCSLQRRCAGIAPDADDDLGAEVTDDIARRDERTQEVSHDSHIAPEALAVKAADLQTADGEARLGHTLHLHAPFGTDEEDIDLGVAPAKGFGDGYGREDMPPCATAADDSSLDHISIRSLVCRYREEALPRPPRSR